MKIFKAALFFLLLANQAYAQGEELTLPDMPLVEESAPQEAPFTQPSKFQESSKSATSKIVTPKTAEESSSAEKYKKQYVQKGTELIEHPLAAKGLIRIEKDGSYIYKTRKTEHKESATLRFGSLQPPNIQSADGQTNFKSMYSQSNIPILIFDYEWQPFTGFGKLGVQTGFSFFTAQGSGRFLATDTTLGETQKAEEKYTFIAVPLNLGVVYRMEFSDHQWLAPYLAGGGSYFPLIELRDDGKSPHAVGTPGAYGAGGLMFNVSSFDRETAYTLDSEYGIKNLWISLEYRYIKTFSPDLDLTAGVINLGVAVDY